MWHINKTDTMIKLLTILTTIFCLTTLDQTNKSMVKPQNDNPNLNIDTSRIAILPFDTTQYWVFKDSKPTDLTNDDLQKIETILNQCVNDYNPEQERQVKEINDKHPEFKLDKKNFTIDLTLYKRQYVAILNAKGEKEVWVNCFCGAGSQNWKKNLILVLDGGNCYFNLKINLTTGQYYEFMVNGDG